MPLSLNSDFVFAATQFCDPDNPCSPDTDNTEEIPPIENDGVVPSGGQDEIPCADGYHEQDAQCVADNQEPVADNQKPTPDAGSSRTVNSGDQVHLDGTNSRDPDCENGGNMWCGKELEYEWEQTQNGPQIFDGFDRSESVVSFTAPSVDHTTKLTFLLRVSDGFEWSDTDSITITVKPTIEDGRQPNQNQLPVADAGKDLTVEVGQEVHLDGTKSQPEGAIKSIKWKQIGSPHVTLLNADTLEPTFNAPPVEQPQKLTFKLVVYANAVPSKPDTVTITVEPTSHERQQPPPNTEVTFNAILSNIKNLVTIIKQNYLSPLLPLAVIGVVAIVGTKAYRKYRSKNSQHKGDDVTVITRGGIE